MINKIWHGNRLIKINSNDGKPNNPGLPSLLTQINNHRYIHTVCNQIEISR